MNNLYAHAGVNIDKGNEVVRRIKKSVKSTHTKAVLTGIGHFGGLYDIGKILKSYKHPILVQSIDGVGTKLSVARMAKKYDSVGEDIVGHSCGDIIAMGARPLTFLDYVAIIGGETAEMPGIYMKGEHDIAGCITGVVEKNKIITGEKIKEGDIMFGFVSSGLHTNGFSLARKLIFEIGKYKINSRIPELKSTIGEVLLKVHTNYTNPVLEMLD